jgi:hypothetical protein
MVAKYGRGEIRHSVLTIVLLAGITIWMALPTLAKAGPTTAPAAQPIRSAVPSEAAQRAAEAQIKDVFGQQIDEARTAQQRRELSATLLDTARHTAELDGKFALLKDAEDLAVRAEDLNGALAVRQTMNEAFDLSAWPAEAEMYSKLDQIANMPQEHRKLCQAMIAAADEAIQADQFAMARQIGEQALASARKTDDRDLSKRAALLISRISTCEAERKRLAPALASLAARPDDPAANAVVGKYECFQTQHWARGLPMLARGNDAALKSLAEAELQCASDRTAQAALADRWWSYAENQPQALRAVIRLHAGLWYAQASEGLTGIVKARAQQRSAEYVKAHTDGAAASAAPAAATVEGFDGAAGMLKALGPLSPATFTRWDENHLNSVNDALRLNIEGNSATVTITVEQIRRSRTQSMMTVNRVEPLGKFTVQINTAFDPLIESQWDAIHVQGTYTLTGTVETAKFNGTRLYCLLTNCRPFVPGQPPRSVASQRRAPGWKPALPLTADEKADFNSVQEVLDAIPLDLMPRTAKEWLNKSASKQFGTAYSNAFSGKSFRCQVIIAKIEKVPQTSMMRISSVKFPISGTQFNFILFMPDTDPQFALLRVGSPSILSGRAGGANWGVNGLTMNLGHPGVAAAK